MTLRLSTDLMELREILWVVLGCLLLLIITHATSLLLQAVDIGGVDAEQAHVLVHLECQLHLIVLDAADYEGLVEGEIALNPCLLHALLRYQGFLNVAILAIAFDHDAVGDEVGFAGGGRPRLQHLLENLRSLRHVEAADTAV